MNLCGQETITSSTSFMESMWNRSGWINAPLAGSDRRLLNHCRNTYRKSKLIRTGCIFFQSYGSDYLILNRPNRSPLTRRPVLELRRQFGRLFLIAISAGPEGNQNARNLAKPWIRALEARPGRQLWGVVVGKLNGGWSLLDLVSRRSCRTHRKRIEPRRPRASVGGKESGIRTWSGTIFPGYRKTIPPPMNTGSARGQTRAMPSGAIPPTDRNSSILPKPKDRVANETDGVGWTDLFHELVSVEAGPSLKCIRALSVPRRSAEIGIQSWFGMEGRLETSVIDRIQSGKELARVIMPQFLGSTEVHGTRQRQEISTANHDFLGAIEQN
ncbi:hypothetical protein B0H14DRAFT_3140934 [Mycena olivaceomarginata]|nr:hypothetical protein B0H14DRAFT_3140934 [Mycena olivaceomarginata]